MTEQLVTADNKQNSSLEEELFFLIWNQVRRVLVFLAPGAAAFIALLASRDASWPYPWFWWISIVCINLGTVASLNAVARSTSIRAHEKLMVIKRWFICQACLISVAHLFVLEAPLSSAVVIGIYFAGVVSSIFPSIAGYPPIYRWMLLILLGPLCLSWAFAPIPDIQWMERVAVAGLIVGYAFALYGYGHAFYSEFVRSFETRVKLDRLVSQRDVALAEAQASNEAKTRFLAAASHDLRQPVHAISLLADGIQKRLREPELVDLASHLSRAATGLSEQINSLLDVSRLDAGLVDPGVKVINLHEAVTNVLHVYADQASQKGLLLSLDIDHRWHVSADPIFLQRIVSNLVSNAIKFTFDGEVTLTARAVEKGFLELVIADEGIGIPAGELERVFEEFYQLQNPERRRESGLGLGLSIVRRLCKISGIELELRSHESIGTEAVLRFAPTCISYLESVPTESDGAQEVHQESFDLQCDVLLVEDEELVVLGMKALLEGCGASCRAVDSYDDALDAIEFRTPNLLITDYRLPGRHDGLALSIDVLRKHSGIHCVLVSGEASHALQTRSERAGIQFVAKPVSPEALRAIVASAMKPAGSLASR